MTTTVPVSVTEKKPLTLEDLSARLELLEALARKRIFKGHYRQGSFGPIEKVFTFEGNLEQAKNRFFQHCKSMGYIFIIVKPYEVDLDAQEKQKLDDPEFVDENLGRRN